MKVEILTSSGWEATTIDPSVWSLLVDSVTKPIRLVDEAGIVVREFHPKVRT